MLLLLQFAGVLFAADILNTTADVGCSVDLRYGMPLHIVNNKDFNKVRVSLH